MSGTALDDAIEVRVRESGDLAACIELTRVVHDVDRYPLVLQANVADFLVSRRLIVAWVAQRGGRIVGHVALHRGSSRAMESMVAKASIVEPDRIGVVSRLMVSPTVRRSGVGRQLLRTAAGEAAGRGLMPALDVVTSYAAAVALYERVGWRRIGTVAVAMPGEDRVDEYVYVGQPEPRHTEGVRRDVTAALRSRHRTNTEVSYSAPRPIGTAVGVDGVVHEWCGLLSMAVVVPSTSERSRSGVLVKHDGLVVESPARSIGTDHGRLGDRRPR